jgi:hypothetical protein
VPETLAAVFSGPTPPEPSRRRSQRPAADLTGPRSSKPCCTTRYSAVPGDYHPCRRGAQRVLNRDDKQSGTCQSGLDAVSRAARHDQVAAGLCRVEVVVRE